MRRPRFIAFDLGGIIVPDATCHIHQGMTDLLHVTPHDFTAAFFRFHDRITDGSISLHEFYVAILGEWGIETVSPRDALDRHLSLYKDAVLSKGFAMCDLLDELKEHHTVVCLTNTEKEVSDLNRRKGLYDLFDRAYISTEMGMLKPCEDIYRAMLDDLGARAEETVFIDDKEENVRSAATMGMISLRFENAEHLRASLAHMLSGGERNHGEAVNRRSRGAPFAPDDRHVDATAGRGDKAIHAAGGD